jgi:plasmid stability protein
MAQIIVRNLEDDVRDKLRELADGYGQSMEEFVREVLRNCAMGKTKPVAKLGSRISSRFVGKGLQEPIRELRGQQLEPPGF